MYTLKPESDLFIVYKGEEPLTTPMGNVVRTKIKPLGEQLVAHLKKYGESPGSPESIVAFHYAFLDFFIAMPRKTLENNVALGLKQQHDWTYSCPSGAPEYIMEWLTIFGEGPTQEEKGREWLATISLMQLCAVCIIGRCLESVNIPFIVATCLKEKQLLSYAKSVHKYFPYVSVAELTSYFENFLFYYHAETYLDEISASESS